MEEDHMSVLPIMKNVKKKFKKFTSSKTPSERYKELESLVDSVNELKDSHIPFFMNHLNLQKMVEVLSEEYVKLFLKLEYKNLLFKEKSDIKKSVGFKLVRLIFLLSYGGKFKVCVGYLNSLILTLKLITEIVEFPILREKSKSFKEEDKLLSNNIRPSVLDEVQRELGRFISVERGCEYKYDKEITMDFILNSSNPCIQLCGFLYFFIKENVQEYIKELINDDHVLVMFFEILHLLSKKLSIYYWKEYTIVADLITFTYYGIFKESACDIFLIHKLNNKDFISFFLSFLIEKDETKDKNEITKGNSMVEKYFSKIFKLYCVENIVLLLFSTMKLVPDLFLQFEQYDGYDILEKFFISLYEKDEKVSDPEIGEFRKLLERKFLTITGVLVCFVLNLGKKLQLLDISDGKKKNRRILLNHNPHVFSIIISLFGHWSENNSKDTTYSNKSVKYFCHFEFLNQIAHVLINFPDEYFRFLYKFKPFQRIVKYFHLLPIIMQEIIIQVFRVYIFFFIPKDKTENELSVITKSFLSLIKETKHLQSVNRVALFLVKICSDDVSGNVQKLYNISSFHRIIVTAFETHKSEQIRKNLLKLLYEYLKGSMKNMKSFLSRKKTLETYHVLKNEHNLINDTLSVLKLIAVQDKKQKWTTIPDLISLLYSRDLSLYLQKSIILTCVDVFAKNSNAKNRFREAKGFECLLEVLRRISFLKSKDVQIFEIVQSIIWAFTHLLISNEKNVKYFRGLDFELIYHPLNQLGFIEDSKNGILLTMNLFQFSFKRLDLYNPIKDLSELHFVDKVKDNVILINNAEILSEVMIKLYGENFEKIEKKLKEFFFSIMKIVTLKTLANRRRLCKVGGLKSFLINFRKLFSNGKHEFHKIVLNQYLILAKYSTTVLELQIFFSLLKDEHFPNDLIDCLIDMARIERLSNHSIYFPPDSERSSRILLPKLSYKNWLTKGYTFTLWFNVEKISTRDKIILMKMGSKKLKVYVYFNNDRRISVQIKFKGVKYEEKSFSLVKFDFNSWNFICISHNMEIEKKSHLHSFVLYVNGFKAQSLKQEITFNDKSIITVFKSYFKSLLSNLALEDIYMGKVTETSVILGNSIKKNDDIVDDDDEEEEEGEGEVDDNNEDVDDDKKAKYIAKDVENDFTSFSIGNMIMIEENINEKESFLMFLLGPNYTGDFDEDITAYFPNNMINHESVKKFKDVYEIKYSTTGFHLTRVSLKILFVFCSRNATFATRLNIHIVSNIQENRRNMSRKSFQIQPPRVEDEYSNKNRHLQNVYRQKDREDPLQISLSIPEFTAVQSNIVGNVKMISRCLFKTNLFVIGGMREVLNFVPTFRRHLRIKLLDLIHHLIKGNAENAREMKQVNGYKLINFIIQQKFFDFNDELLVLILKLCGFEANEYNNKPALKSNDNESFMFLENGILSNRKAFFGLLLDFQIWKNCDFEFQGKVYKTILYMVNVHGNKEFHIKVFRLLGVVEQIFFTLGEIFHRKIKYNNIVVNYMIQIVRRILKNPIKMKFYKVIQDFLFLTHPTSICNEKKNVFNMQYPRERTTRLLYEKIIRENIPKSLVNDILMSYPVVSIFIFLDVPSSLIRSTWLDILSFFISFPSLEEKYYSKSMIRKISRQLKKHDVSKIEISALFNLFIGKRDILIKKDLYELYPKLKTQFEDFLTVILSVIPSIYNPTLQYNTLEVLYNIFNHGDIKFKKLFVVKDLHFFLKKYLSKSILKGGDKKLFKLILDFLTHYLIYIMNEKKGMVSIESILKKFYFIEGYNKKSNFYGYVQKIIISKILRHFLLNFLLRESGELPRKWDILFTRFCSIVVNILRLFHNNKEKTDDNNSDMDEELYIQSLIHEESQQYNTKEYFETAKVREWYELIMKQLDVECDKVLFTEKLSNPNALMYWIMECIRLGLGKIYANKKKQQSTIFFTTIYAGVTDNKTKTELMTINTLKQLILLMISKENMGEKLCGLLYLLNLRSHSDVLLLEEFLKDRKFTFHLVYKLSNLLQKENINSDSNKSNSKSNDINSNNILFFCLEEVRGIILKKKKIYFNKLTVKMQNNYNNTEFKDLLSSVYKWENKERLDLSKEMKKMKENYDKKVQLLKEIEVHSEIELKEIDKMVKSEIEKVEKIYVLHESQYLFQADQSRYLWKTRMKRFFMNERNILCNYSFITRNTPNNAMSLDYKNEKLRDYKPINNSTISGQNQNIIRPWKLDGTTGQNRVRSRIRKSYQKFVDLSFCQNKNKLTFFNVIPNEKILSKFLCKRVSPAITYNGTLYILTNTFYFRGKKESNLNDHEEYMLSNSNSVIKEKVIHLKYQNVEEVHKRRYMLQNNALEVFFTNGKSYFFAFPSEGKRDSSFKFLYNFKRCPNLKKYRTEKLQQKWKNWEISNFEYLLHLNTLSGRSFNDLTQYPVFPHIIADYSSSTLDLSKPSTFRDLSKPMGALNSKRLEKAKEKYECLKMSYSARSSSPEQKPFFWGTHYLAPMTSVLFYLIRLEPFTSIFWKMNDSKIDEPGRSFFSIKQCWESSSGSNNVGTSDVRELIPEFFFLPEMMQNRNRVKWNLFMDKYVVDDVTLPSWSTSSLDFIRKHRSALECDYVSKNLHNWIDLIFGCKQRGEEAEKSYNVFHHYCYETSFEHTRDKIELEAMKTMVLNHGQVPKQLFKKKHVKRNEKVNNLLEITQNTAKLLKTHTVNIFRETIGDILIYDDNNTICVGLNKILLPKTKKKGTVELSTQSEHSDKKSTDMRYLCYEHEWNKSMKVCEWNTGKDIYSFFDGTRLDYYTCAMFSSDGSLLATGSDYACIHIYEMDIERRIILKKLVTLYGHSKAVKCIYISNLTNLCISGSNDCTVIFWDIKKFSYITSIRFQFPVIKICLNSQTGDVAVLTKDNTLHLYTENGDLIIKKRFKNIITALCFSHYKMGVEKNMLFCGYINGTLDILDSETFKRITKLHPSKEINASITHITQNTKQTTLGITDIQGIAVTLKVDQ